MDLQVSSEIITKLVQIHLREYHANDRFAQIVHGSVRKETRRRRVMDKGDPEIFGYFAEHLYRNKWPSEEQIISSSLL